MYIGFTKYDVFFFFYVCTQKLYQKERSVHYYSHSSFSVTNGVFQFSQKIYIEEKWLFFKNILLSLDYFMLFSLQVFRYLIHKEIKRLKTILKTYFDRY